MFLSKRKLTSLMVFCLLLGGAIMTVIQSFALDSKRNRTPYREDVIENLSLDESQILRLDVILEDYRGRVSVLNETFREDYRTVRTEIRSQIRDILSPEQVARYNEMMEERDARRRSHRSRK